MKLSLIPKLANPLLDLVALMERSFKSDEEDNTKTQEPTPEHREPKSQAETTNKEKTTEPAPSDTTDAGQTDSPGSVEELIYSQSIKR
ncbi:hypothetical protein OS493_007332 [Desmophyllum pertusum]|uniref:Uncharacterized protein n=1 Tax=Desmophyllum pertusum TaxID=174260 RepID=A0A9W9Z2Q0_9CNID|nr:hypothetical protein OS493_007332 [Desmophyllum pertusum]